VIAYDLKKQEPFMKPIALISSLFLLSPLAASELPKEFPEELLGTHKAQFKRLKSAGKHIGCTIDYTVLHKNSLSRLDTFYTEGHISTLIANGQPMMMFKFGLQPLSNIKSTTNVNFAYLGSGDIDTSAVENISFEEVKGFKTFGYVLDQKTALLLLNLAKSNNLIISYNLTEDGFDHSFNVDLSVKELEVSATEVKKIRNSSTGTEFQECTSKLIDQAINELNQAQKGQNS